MEHVFNKKSVAFFEGPFQRQVRDQEYALNPFELLAIDYVKGSVLDLGCGLGNFSLETLRVKGFRCEASGGHRELDHRPVVRHHCCHRVADVFPPRNGA